MREPEHSYYKRETGKVLAGTKSSDQAASKTAKNKKKCLTKNQVYAIIQSEREKEIKKMKIVLIVIAVLFVLFKALKNTKAYHEAVLLTDLRKHINDKSLLQGLTMNSIQSRAAIELMDGKIREEFYYKMFCGGDAKTPWWEANRKNIEG